MELIEENLLPGTGSADAAQAEGPPIGRLQEDVAALDAPQAVQGLLWGERRPGPLESVFQRDPQGVAEEGHQDVGLHAGRLLMPDGPDRELALEGAEGRLAGPGPPRSGSCAGGRPLHAPHTTRAGRPALARPRAARPLGRSRRSRTARPRSGSAPGAGRSVAGCAPPRSACPSPPARPAASGPLPRIGSPAPPS